MEYNKMATKELPKQLRYICDLCKAEHIGEAFPKGWSKLSVNFNNVELSDGYKKNGTMDNLFLCPKHSELLILNFLEKSEKIL